MSQYLPMLFILSWFVRVASALKLSLISPLELPELMKCVCLQWIVMN